MISTNIPGMAPIDLPQSYPQFASYYPNCEMGTKGWFVKNVKPNWTLIDVGANIGYYTILFAKLAPKGTVHAIEPTDTHAMLVTNVQHHRLQNVKFHRIALGKRTGQITDGIFRIWGSNPEVKTYPFMTLDDFVAKQGLSHVDAVKIDVDSFDWEVLQGGVETLKHMNPFVMVELNYALAKRGQTAGQALAWLAGLGYKDPPVFDGENYLLKRSA